METLIKQYLSLALRSIRTRKLRSWLTILGIVVGIFLVVALVSLSSGLKNSIMSQLQGLGGNVIFVMPGSMDNMMMMMAGGQTLSEDDIDAIRKVKGTGVVLPASQKAELMRFNNEQKAVFLQGMSWEEGRDFLISFQGWKLKEGRWPSSGKRELVIGSLVTERNFFGKRMEPGDKTTISGRTFTVVGVLESLGNQTDDSSVYLDLSVFQEVTGEKSGEAMVVMAEVREGYEVDAVASKIEDALEEVRKRRRGEDVFDFSVVTSESMSNIAGGITGAIQAAVFLFAGISILVGGLGIMNTMYTAVRERTREIGVLKAVGARSKDVIMIILFESGIIGLIGGTGGVVFGLIVAKLVENVTRGSTNFVIEAYMPFSLIFFGLFFSLVVGCLSGYLPARTAAKLKPTEALRSYE